MARGFVGHFEKRAARSTSDKCDSHYKEPFAFDRLLIEEVSSMQVPSNTDGTPVEVMKITKSFKTTKQRTVKGLLQSISVFLPILCLVI